MHTQHTLNLAGPEYYIEIIQNSNMTHSDLWITNLDNDKKIWEHTQNIWKGDYRENTWNCKRGRTLQNKNKQGNGHTTKTRYC